MKNIIKFKKFFLLVVILCLTLPVITFAFTRGQDGYNYYNYNSNNNFSGKIFGGSVSGGGGLYCSGGSTNPTFCSIVSFLIDLMSKAIPILVSISVIVFVWGVFKYVMVDGEDRDKSRNVMMYGIIGLFVMVSVWGLVAIVTNTFNLENTNSLYYYGNRSGGGYGGGSGGTSGGVTEGGYDSGDSSDNGGSDDDSNNDTDNNQDSFELPSINI